MSTGKFDRDRAALDVLLKQYEFLRDEVTQCINLEHIAILGLYTFLGLVTASLIGGLLLDSSNSHFSFESPFFLLALVFAQVIICGFGSLFLKEQARNRRACSFLNALEHLINEKIGEIGIYWENYIVSDFIERYPINLQYYIHRLGGVGLPIFLPNLLITLGISYAIYGRINIILLVSIFFLAAMILLDLLIFLNLPILLDIILRILVIAILFFIFYGKCNLFLLLYLIISALITFLWALTIAYETYSPLVREKIPKDTEILEWLEKEQSKIL